MRQLIGSALVQIKQLIAYSAPSHYLNQCWIIVNWTLRNKLQWHFNQNTKLYIHKNASENTVCEMAVILSRGRWVNAIWCILYPPMTEADVPNHLANRWPYPGPSGLGHSTTTGHLLPPGNLLYNAGILCDLTAQISPFLIDGGQAHSVCVSLCLSLRH